MSALNAIIGGTQGGKSHDEDWLLLRNVYFRDGDGWSDLKKWADVNKLNFTQRIIAVGQNSEVKTIITFCRRANKPASDSADPGSIPSNDK